MALFGNKESAEIAALQQQLSLAHATIAELRGWVGQLRGAETIAQEVELRQLRSAVDQSKNEYAALDASRQQVKAEVDAWRSQLVETRELALLQEVGVYGYAHPLDDALSYQDALNALQQQLWSAPRPLLWERGSAGQTPARWHGLTPDAQQRAAKVRRTARGRRA